MDEIRAAIQAALDACGDGWSLQHFAIPMIIERVTADGEIQSEPWLLAPADQPEWVTRACIREWANDAASQGLDTDA